MASYRTRTEQIEQVIRETLDNRTSGILGIIARHASTLDRLAVEACNGPAGVERMNGQQIDRWQTSLEREDERYTRLICDRVRELPIGWKLSMQGDPRGFVVRLLAPNGRCVGISSDEIGPAHWDDSTSINAEGQA